MHKKIESSVLLVTSILCFLFLINGCVSPEESRRQYEQNQRNYLARLQVKCDGYGFTRGTDAYAQCLQKADRDEADAYQVYRQQQQDRWKAAQCYSTGRLDC